LNRTDIASSTRAGQYLHLPRVRRSALVASEPRLAGRSPQLVVRGGTHGSGNVTAVAEFNFWTAPEAAQTVLDRALGTRPRRAETASTTGSKEPATVRLAFIALLQRLTPRHRAALALREILSFSARETAEIFGTTVAVVDSSLQRARITEPLGLPAPPVERIGLVLSAAGLRDFACFGVDLAGWRLVATGADTAVGHGEELRLPSGFRADVDGMALNSLVRAGWRHVAPKRLVAAVDQAEAAEPGEEDLQAEIGRPATRALHSAGLATLNLVTAKSENELLELHGVGPRAVRILNQVPAEQGRSLRR
jgi:hypothetical protein